MTAPGLFAGAYAASPAHSRWDARAEEEFFDLLTGIDELRGLELPWTGALHPHDDEWLLQRFPARFEAVLSGIPGTMKRLKADSTFGLASDDPDGRAAAVREALALRDGARRLNDATGRQAVVAIEVHSAPPGGGSAEALRLSLAQLGAEDWDGAAIVVEHCDALVPGQRPEKGFLRVEDELSALDGLPGGIGMSLNWGRSAIELRDPDAVAGQVEAVAASGRLHGLMLSGASAVASPFGPPWADAHHPMAPAPGFPEGERASLLTVSRADSAARAAGPLRWAGFKFGWADRTAGAAPRAAMVAAAARTLAPLLSAAQRESIRG